MKNIVIALFATLMVTGCLFSKKEETAPADAAPAEQAAPADAGAAPAPTPEPAHAE